MDAVTALDHLLLSFSNDTPLRKEKNEETRPAPLPASQRHQSSQTDSPALLNRGCQAEVHQRSILCAASPELHPKYQQTDPEMTLRETEKMVSVFQGFQKDTIAFGSQVGETVASLGSTLQFLNFRVQGFLRERKKLDLSRQKEERRTFSLTEEKERKNIEVRQLEARYIMMSSFVQFFYHHEQNFSSFTQADDPLLFLLDDCKAALT
eukprot:gene9252-6505_t